VSAYWFVGACPAPKRCGCRRTILNCATSAVVGDAPPGTSLLSSAVTVGTEVLGSISAQMPWLLVLVPTSATYEVVCPFVFDRTTTARRPTSCSTVASPTPRLTVASDSARPLRAVVNPGERGASGRTTAPPKDARLPRRAPTLLRSEVAVAFPETLTATPRSSHTMTPHAENETSTTAVCLVTVVEAEHMSAPAPTAVTSTLSSASNT